MAQLCAANFLKIYKFISLSSTKSLLFEGHFGAFLEKLIEKLGTNRK